MFSNYSGIIPFIIPFYPNKNTFLKTLDFFIKKKIKIFEIGFPCNDSYCDGKIISEAYNLVIKKNKNLIKKTIKQLLLFRKMYNKCIVIVVCYSYTIENYGVEKFLKLIKNFSNALLIIDQPIEYVLNYNYLYKINKVKFICFINYYNKSKINLTLNKIKNKECLFVYLALSNGSTGSKNNINYLKVKEVYEYIKKRFNIPIVVGFGIVKNNIELISKKFKRYIVGSFLIYNIKKDLNKFKDFVKFYIDGNNKIKKIKK